MEKEISIPDNVLKQKEMTSILTDVQIAQASLNSKARSDTSAQSMNEYIFNIMKKHNTTKQEFLISLKFYTDHPEILQQVYDSVITGLSRMEAGVEK